MRGQLNEIWKIQSNLQFRQLHCVSNGRFLLSGGLHLPGKRQSEQVASVALIDGVTSNSIWTNTFPSHMCYESSCVTASEAVCVISHPYKSQFCGAMRFSVDSGERVGEIPVEGIEGVVSLPGATFVLGISAKPPRLCFQSDSGVHEKLIADHSETRLHSIRNAGDDKFFTVLAQIVGKPESKAGHVEFCHQLRQADGCLVWEYCSRHESIIPAGDEVFVFTNAAEKSRSEIEVLDAHTGEFIRAIRVPMSIASPVLIEKATLVFCNSSYELCVFDINENRLRQFISFPKEVPGWLEFAFDQATRTLLACKVDNFFAPKSTIAAYSYEPCN